MNPVEEQIRLRLDGFPDEFAPLAEAASRYLRYCSAVDVDDTVLIGHMPWKAPLAYAFRLYPPAEKSWFARYAQLCDIRVPTKLRPLLAATNGCFAFGLSLFGMPPSMLRSPPSLDRSKLQCLDLSLANGDTGWKHDYKGGADGFHFGGRSYRSEVAGYFLLGGTRIVSLLKDGVAVGEWDDLGFFLRDELAAAEALELAETPADWWH